MHGTNPLSKISFYLGILIIVFAFLFPFAWMTFGSLKPGVKLMEIPPDWTSPPTHVNYENVFVKTEFLRRTFNSFVISGLAVSAGMLFGLPAAYSIARFKRRSLGFIILITRMIPGISFGLVKVLAQP